MRILPTIQSLHLPTWRAVGTAVLAALLASCGGGEQIQPFQPVRLITIGDELSVLTAQAPTGRKYGINALAADGVSIDCTTYPIWTQTLAATYAFAFAECNPLNLAQTLAHTYAQPGAKADDFVTQVARAEADGAFSDKDLVSVLLGTNDVLDLYRTVYVPNPTTDTYNAVITELGNRGKLLGERINQLIARGPRVILSTIQRVGQSPYAIEEAALWQDPQRPTVLNNFSIAFNNALRVAIVNDGHFIGLVELDALINAALANPGGYGLANITEPACVAALPDCTTATLVSGATAAPTAWLWASNTWMGITAQQYLGTYARGRAQGNPF